MVILITGISSGFGLEIARRLSAEGHVVYGTVRRDVPHIDGVRYLHADMSSYQDALDAVSIVISEQGCIDTLICNAGMGISGPIEFASEEDIALQMDINFGGQTRFVKAVLPYMRKAGKGRIICFSSLGGRIGLPLQGYYSASKFAIEGFAESLRIEVRPFGIDVVVIEPGDFCTGFTNARKKSEASPDAISAYPYLVNSTEHFESDEKNGLKPDYLAKKISKIVNCRKPRCRYVVSTIQQRFSILLKTLLPDSLFSRILGNYYKVSSKS